MGKLHELGQSEEKNMHNFKARLFKALTLLHEKGFLTSFEIKPSKHLEQFMVHVNKAQGPVKALSRTVTQRLPAAQAGLPDARSRANSWALTLAASMSCQPAVAAALTIQGSSSSVSSSPWSGQCWTWPHAA